MRLLAIATLAVILTPLCAQNNHSIASNQTSQPQNDQQGIQPASGIAHAETANKSDCKPTHDPQASNSGHSFEGWSLGLTLVIALAALVQAGTAIWQARVYERQYKIMSDALIASNQSADAALKGVVALEKLERPFLMIEVRDMTHVWAINKGKVPAQIIWINPMPKFIWPLYDEELPADYSYGLNYYNPHVEIMNVEWLAPGSEKHLCYFDPSVLSELGGDLKNDLTGGRRTLYFLSAIKYRGMLNDTIFESRWCYRWAMPPGLFLSGPYGYNKYT